MAARRFLHSQRKQYTVHPTISSKFTNNAFAFTQFLDCINEARIFVAKFGIDRSSTPIIETWIGFSAQLCHVLHEFIFFVIRNAQFSHPTKVTIRRVGETGKIFQSQETLRDFVNVYPYFSRTGRANGEDCAVIRLATSIKFTASQIRTDDLQSTENSVTCRLTTLITVRCLKESRSFGSIVHTCWQDLHENTQQPSARQVISIGIGVPHQLSQVVQQAIGSARKAQNMFDKSIPVVPRRAWQSGW